MRGIKGVFLGVAIGVCFGGNTHAGPSFSMSDATPEGSWQKRQSTTVDPKGNTEVSDLYQSLLEKVERDGETYYWIEIAVSNYKVNRKGKRKAQGKPTVMKMLVAKSAFDADPANAMSNLSGFGEEIIMQVEGERPLRITKGGMFADSFLKAFGVNIEYTFEDTGTEEVEVPGGSFRAETFRGHGRATSKILFKEMTVESDSKIWLSPDVPFGLVKSVSRDTINGKLHKSESILLEAEGSGAVPRITEEPVDMPNLKDMMGGS